MIRRIVSLVMRRKRRIYDWARDFPELRTPRAAHVRVLNAEENEMIRSAFDRTVRPFAWGQLIEQSI